MARMKAITLIRPQMENPLAAVEILEREEPVAQDGWTTVDIKAASLNHHDVWNMRGVGVDPSWLPCVLGSDGAGIDAEGNEVIVYPLIADPARGGGDETLDPRRRMLADGIDGTFAARVAVPRANLVPKPAALSWETAACLGTAWLTAYRMLFRAAALKSGDNILVQGAGGGLSTALVQLAKASGIRVWVTSRNEARGTRAVEDVGADAWFPAGERLPERVDAVMDSAGEATFEHSLKALRPGGVLVTAGATGGAAPRVDLTRVFLNQLRVVGTAMGTADELRALAELCATAQIEPVIDSVHDLRDGLAGIERMVSGEVFGKVLLRPEPTG